MPFRIAIVVHGRFHAFDLGRELLKRGHDVTVFTNYPAFVAARFGIPKDRVRSYMTHGVLSRLTWRLFPGGLGGRLERHLNLRFARWAARQVVAEQWDVVVAFSGVAEETFQRLADRPTLRVLQRGSADIAVQRRILEDESIRVGSATEVPSDWIVDRERREYALANVVHVLSAFAEQSFLDEGVDGRKLFRLNLGVNTIRFRATEGVITQRISRIVAGNPLHVLHVGTFCCRKGALDWIDVITRLAGPRFRFRFVGPVAPDAIHLAKRLRGLAEFTGKFPQDQLPAHYHWGDVFVLPTLEDGFAAVLTQALAAGLPLITTFNCAGPDLISENIDGWLVPLRTPVAIIDRLRWLDTHRTELAGAVRIVYANPRNLDWAETARQAECNFIEARARMQAAVTGKKNGN